MTAAKNVREALLPCPFCQSANVTVGYDGQPAKTMYVVCNACGVQGPSEHSDFVQFTGRYVEYWNTRKLSATAAGDAKDYFLIGETTDCGVVWHRSNPHAFPLGTKFYALAAQESPQ